MRASMSCNSSRLACSDAPDDSRSCALASESGRNRALDIPHSTFCGSAPLNTGNGLPANLSAYCRSLRVCQWFTFSYARPSSGGFDSKCPVRFV